MGRIRTRYRYVIDIIGTGPFSLGELGAVNLEKLEKLKYFNLRTGDRILMKFDNLEGSHFSKLLFQIPTRSVDIGGIWRGKPEILENAYKRSRYVIDVTGLDPLSFGGVRWCGSALW